MLQFGKGIGETNNKSIKEKMTKILIDNGGKLSVCNKVFITMSAFDAYKSGVLKMTKKVKYRFFNAFGVVFD